METFEGDVIQADAEDVVSGLRNLLQAYSYETVGIIDAEQAEAHEQVQHYHHCAEELEEKREALQALEQEYDSLPGEAYRASLDGDAMREEELRGRYATVREEIPRLRSRVQELEAEVRRLCPDSLQIAPQFGVELHAHKRASQIASSRHAEAKKLAADIEALVEEHLGPIHRRAESLSVYLQQHSDLLERARRGEHV